MRINPIQFGNVMNKLSIFFVIILFSNTLQAQKQNDIQSTFSKSYVLEAEGKYSLAISTLKSVYQADNYMQNARIAWLYFLLADYKQSVVHYDNAIKLKPYAIEARLGVVKSLAELKEWGKVKKQYLEILRIDPQNTFANYWLGLVYYNNAEYSQAVKLFEKNVNLYPFDYDSVIMLAWAKLKSGNKADAKILFNQALLIKPEDTSALEGLEFVK